MNKVLIGLLVFKLFTPTGFGQYQSEAQTTIFNTGGIENPVKLNVSRNEQGRIRFEVINETYYPFLITLEFSEMRNLMPELYYKSYYVVYNGRKNLVTLSKVDENKNHYYRYNWSYTVGDYRLKPDTAFPYLFPIQNGHALNVDKDVSKNSYCPRNNFRFKEYDTIYAMRKGMVTATPKMYIQTFRISEDNAVEIYHEDGTVLIYRNMDVDNCFVFPGQKVYPGQPIGLAKNYISTTLYSIHGKKRAKRIEINYALDEKNITKYNSSLNGKIVTQPEKIVLKELTKREKRKYLKGTLYEN